MQGAQEVGTDPSCRDRNAMKKNHKVACMSIGGHAHRYGSSLVSWDISDLCGPLQRKHTVEQQAYSLPAPLNTPAHSGTGQST